MSKGSFKYAYWLTIRWWILLSKRYESREVNPPTFQKIFGDSAVAKVLDFLTLYKEFDYPKVEISRNSGVAWKTLYRIWPILERYGLVTLTRRIGRAKLYRLNIENPIVKALNELAFQIAKYDADKLVKKEVLATA